uniref:Cytochrome b n=1 Tax=Orbilia brochopaga TaxID=3140254 RepID=A0A481ZLP2_9PEZI|nr:cytochrome c oxidase subunit II [Drechslerella brochopaga]QBL02575.1 cytochrome c oxidase subunit II [Drechslerella brochopaga]
MRLLKSHPLLKLINSYLFDGSQPSNLNFAWNFGSLLAVCLIIQLVTGVTLGMHYNGSVSQAFDSVEHVMRDVNNGWLIRYFHSNTASAFFFLVKLFLGRGIYYGSYQAPRTLTWVIGAVILIAMMGTGFLGYVHSLKWSDINIIYLLTSLGLNLLEFQFLAFPYFGLFEAESFLIHFMSAIPWLGQDIVEFIWGGFSVNNATLNRFFALHFLLPFVLAILVLLHLITLHETGAGNPVGSSSNSSRINMSPYYLFKDLITLYLFIWVLSFFVYFMPNFLGDSENYVPANPMQTPAAIVPEWYLLSFYAILRSIPNKLLGVLAMFGAILAILTLPYFDTSKLRGFQFKPTAKIIFWMFVANFVILIVLGAKHVESPFIIVGQCMTFLYFIWYINFIPATSLSEDLLSTVELNNSKSISSNSFSFSSIFSKNFRARIKDFIIIYSVNKPVADSLADIRTLAAERRGIFNAGAENTTEGRNRLLNTQNSIWEHVTEFSNNMNTERVPHEVLTPLINAIRNAASNVDPLIVEVITQLNP